MSQARTPHHAGNGRNGNSATAIPRQAPAEIPPTYHNRAMYEKFVRHLIGVAHGTPANEVVSLVLPEHQAAMRELLNGTEQLWRTFVEKTKKV